ncbi:MAG: hypothetical protein GY847_41690 [Proteobacteria bacterium]|nr:hypothetical protein [Pseudomonadota bacterium]
MKTIVITGGGRHVGKTTLAGAFGKLLEDSRVVKLGTHAARDDKPELFFPRGTPFVDVNRAVSGCKYLVIESGTILDDPDLTPDLLVFLPAGAERQDKPGSERRRAKADLVRGEPVTTNRAKKLSERLVIDLERFEAMLDAAGVPVLY